MKIKYHSELCWSANNNHNDVSVHYVFFIVLINCSHFISWNSCKLSEEDIILFSYHSPRCTLSSAIINY